mmetsp:Transcript_14809/g.56037  ORF Transcript_14809/g.56037 Transcript_14809/m.56037 type:complete len:281 (-) Transcript_14809:371-1213(-)
MPTTVQMAPPTRHAILTSRAPLERYPAPRVPSSRRFMSSSMPRSAHAPTKATEGARRRIARVLVSTDAMAALATADVVITLSLHSPTAMAPLVLTSIAAQTHAKCREWGRRVSARVLLLPSASSASMLSRTMPWYCPRLAAAPTRQADEMSRYFPPAMRYRGRKVAHQSDWNKQAPTHAGVALASVSRMAGKGAALSGVKSVPNCSSRWKNVSPMKMGPQMLKAQPDGVNCERPYCASGSLTLPFFSACSCCAASLSSLPGCPTAQMFSAMAAAPASCHR